MNVPSSVAYEVEAKFSEVNISRVSPNKIDGQDHYESMWLTHFYLCCHLLYIFMGQKRVKSCTDVRIVVSQNLMVMAKVLGAVRKLHYLPDPGPIVVPRPHCGPWALLWPLGPFVVCRPPCDP